MSIVDFEQVNASSVNGNSKTTYKDNKDSRQLNLTSKYFTASLTTHRGMGINKDLSLRPSRQIYVKSQK